MLEAEDGERSKMRCSGHRSVMLRQRLPTGRFMRAAGALDEPRNQADAEAKVSGAS
jgi:hypothetical protein